MANVLFAGQVIWTASINPKFTWSSFMAEKSQYLLSTLGVMIWDVVIIVQGHVYSNRSFMK